jgi:tetratricopeptide (TPR) repeat protein
MKRTGFPLIFVVFILSCNSGRAPIVIDKFIDSLLSHYTIPALARTNAIELGFWKNKMNEEKPGLINVQNYTNALLMRYNLFGDIRDLNVCDSLINGLFRQYGKEDQNLPLTLAGYNLILRKLREARKWLQIANMQGQQTVEKKEVLLTLEFDLFFESGQYDSAAVVLASLKKKADYAYFFRLSRMEDLNGFSDSAIYHILKAAELAKANDYQKQLALTQAAEFYIRLGNFKKANDIYRYCINLNPCDFKSILGFGWIALTSDKDDSLSEKIFRFVGSHFKTPDPLYELSLIAGSRQDENMQYKFAKDFAAAADDSIFGNRYNLELIDLYTGILHLPGRAEILAQKETINRPSPQSFAWYSWALFKNNKKDQALQVFQRQITGRSLDGLSAYWIGKLLKSSQQETQAAQFFDSARKMPFNLSPEKRKDLENEPD